MRFTLSDIKHFTENAPEHSIQNYQIVVSAVDKKPIEPEIKAISQRLARQRKTNPLLLWYIGISKSESRGTCKRDFIRDGKRGRPRVIVRGKQTEPHAHIFLSSRKKTEPPTNDYNQILMFIKKRRKKYKALKQPKSSQIHGMGYVNYSQRQSEHIFKTPDYDFDYFLSPFYDDSLLDF